MHTVGVSENVLEPNYAANAAVWFEPFTFSRTPQPKRCFKSAYSCSRGTGTNQLQLVLILMRAEANIASSSISDATKCATVGFSSFLNHVH